MQSLFISRVVIKNFRNFKNVDVNLGHKQVIIGENNVGKTNFLKALQLILDPTLSDEDRMLDESDFNDTLVSPMENKEEIKIDIYISNYQNNKTVLTVLQDATVKNVTGEEKLLLTYRFFPYEDDMGNVEYQYSIYKAGDEAKKFGAYERKYLNLKVIKALRDVEGEMRNTRTSPVKKMLDEYAIDKAELERIAEEYKKSGEEILNLDELIDLTSNINKRFSTILGNSDFDVSLQAMEVDPNKVLSSLKLLMSNRNTADISLGLNNILYISMVLQMFQDKTIPSFLKVETYNELIEKGDSKILSEVYELKKSGNYFLKDGIPEDKTKEIYTFMDKYMPTNKGVTILAIEEPEAHLHPVNQRLIYKDVIKNSHNSVLLTTHSTHITAIAPIESIVHLHAKIGNGTTIHATAAMPINDGEFLDVERYLDVKRGEIYLGKGVILVEGIAEEYLVPKFAEALDKPLDEKGIIVCNINCTNFTPYVKLLRNLDIPYTVITDGDFYYIDEKKDERVYHVSADDVDEDNVEIGYLGLEVIERMVKKIGMNGTTLIPADFQDADIIYRTYGIFIGNNTFEVDMMYACRKNATATQVFIDLFNELTEGGKTQKINFEKEINTGCYWKCLSKIDGNGIGKGRFAQKLVGRVCESHIPDYIEKAINYIYQKVDV
ncbi:AAA family ATPase [Clostridium estertheticum]|uniref:ATP-dependent nuclease n=1 Tax=Clostridium estertheticum TaxID=238834 RepID=UPI001C0C4C98|nr:AAA family ATPase [Clostridium estertheticum]MBU3175191.1 AAA family ATPase [Clostridium estertheticum]